MSGGASFNSSFEVAPMREPVTKTKGYLFFLICFQCLQTTFSSPDSMLSAEAPEFIPRIPNLVSPNLIHASQHRNQHPINQNAFRSQGPLHHFSVSSLNTYKKIRSYVMKRKFKRMLNI